MRLRLNRHNWVYYIGKGSNLRKLLFSISCMLILLGSSFRPQPGPLSARGSADLEELVASESQQLPEPEDKLVKYSVYMVQKGDTLSGIANSFDLSLDSLISMNNLKSAKSLRPGQLLRVPSQSGIVYTAPKDTTVQEIAESYQISVDRIIEANGLLSERVASGSSIFLPDAKLPAATLREISGTLFRWPVRGHITSWYGWRKDPFSGRRTFHSAIDIAAPYGTPIYAAGEGRVTETGYSPITGRFVVIAHSGGFKSLYGHMSEILVQEGARVASGSLIGRVGTTGYSTGPHVHFVIMKSGSTVNPINYLP